MNKQMVKEIGIGTLKVAKRVIIKGTVMVAMEAVGHSLNTFLSEGTSGVKRMNLDKLLGMKEEPHIDEMELEDSVVEEEVELENVDDLSEGEEEV